MPDRICSSCGTRFTPRSPRDRRCPLHQGSHSGWSHNRDPVAQRRFRAALRARAGDRCEELDELTGERCTETHDLRACHLVSVADGGSYHPSNGKLRCRRHDRATDPRAR